MWLASPPHRKMCSVPLSESYEWGSGTFSAVKTLRDAGIEVRSISGLRTGLVTEALARLSPAAKLTAAGAALSDYFFDAEGSLPYCPSAQFARQVQASRSPLLQMLSLHTGPLLAPLSVWRRPLSVDTCTPMMACRRFGALEQPPRL